MALLQRKEKKYKIVWLFFLNISHPDWICII